MNERSPEPGNALPEIVIYELSRLLNGMGLSGALVGMFPVPWPEVFRRTALETGDRTATLMRLLEERGFDESEQRYILGGIQAANPLGPPPPIIYAGNIPFLSSSELEDLPPPRYVVADVLQANSASVLYGDTGLGKTLVSLSMALAVVTGQPWFGKETLQGPVVYMLGEGADDAPRRKRAWEYCYNAGEAVPDDFVLVPTGLDLRDPSVVEDLLWGALAKLGRAPVLVVVDTLARNMRGGNENDTLDMGTMVDSFDRIWRSTGAAVLAIHHTNKNSVMRGSVVLPSDLNTVIRIEGDPENDDIRLLCEKQRNGPPFAPMGFRRIKSLTSVTVQALGGAGAEGGGKSLKRRRLVLGVLAREDNATGITATLLKEQLGIETAAQKTSLFEILERLLNERLIAKQLTGAGRYGTYKITPAGRDMLITMDRELRKGRE